MTRKELREHCEKQIRICEIWSNAAGVPKGKIYEEHKLILELLEKEPKWIPVVERPLTDEEREEYGEDIEFMYDCILPEDGQEVLVSTPYGVRQTRFFTDYGYYFEDYEDKGEVIAWMSLPTPFEPQESESDV